MPEQTSPLRQRMIDDMTIRNMAVLTQAAYVRAVKNFSKHFGRSPDKLTFEHVREYQLSLVNRGLGAQAVNQIMCALQFFHKTTMGIKDAHGHIPLARRSVARCARTGASLSSRHSRRGSNTSSGGSLPRLRSPKRIRYGLNHWDGLTRFLDDGRIELDTNIVERGIRPIVLNRKNALFAGHDAGAENWACIASLIETCKLKGVDPQAYFADVLTRLVNLWPASRLDDLMPWAWAAQRSVNKLAA